jgi:hypothetical protein
MGAMIQDSSEELSSDPPGDTFTFSKTWVRSSNETLNRASGIEKELRLPGSSAFIRAGQSNATINTPHAVWRECRVKGNSRSLSVLNSMLHD